MSRTAASDGTRGPAGVGRWGEEGRCNGESSEPGGTGPTPTGIRVLLVEDNQVNREIMSECIAFQGHTVFAAADGPEALRLLEAHRPDVLILDVQIPGMDGLEVTRRIRALADRQLAAVPVIGLTGLAMPGDRQRCLEAGMNEYATKPTPYRKLDVLLRRLAGQARIGAGPGS